VIYTGLNFPFLSDIIRYYAILIAQIPSNDLREFKSGPTVSRGFNTISCYNILLYRTLDGFVILNFHLSINKLKTINCTLILYLIYYVY